MFKVPSTLVKVATLLILVTILVEHVDRWDWMCSRNVLDLGVLHPIFLDLHLVIAW